MKRFLYILLLPLSILCSCIYEDEADCCRPTKVRVEMAVRPDPLMTVTRSADEYAIRDLNFYLYNDNGESVLHRYQTSATLRFECLPGGYRMRVVANQGCDLGENPAWEDFIVAHADEYDVLPMSYESDVTISPSPGGILTLPTVEVRRCVAKVSYNISVKPADIELRSVQLLSVPRSVSVFDIAAAPSDNPNDYTDCPETELAGQQASGANYLFPNMQGMVPSITDQRQKSPENAPANASYLLIRAVRGSKVLAYYVYLGSNNTSDFNVRANVHYRLNISILGDKEVDTRISSYTLRVRDDFDDYNYGGYCLLDGTRYLYIDVDSPDGTAPTCGRLEVLSGDLDCFTFNYGDKGAVHDFDLYDSSGENAYEMEYYTPVYTPENSLLSYRITLTDALGFTQRYDFSHRMANAAIIRTDGGGSVRVEGALHVETESEGSGERTVALCMENCMLTAVPDAGYAFDGWYDSPQEYGHLLSTEQTYEYVPLGPLRHIYAVFQPATTALDADGTANCYIARSLNTVYSFDAATMGNGRTTTNLWPSSLSGVAARVLWETGTSSRIVIRDAVYENGRIVFTTGSARGNAVIGLFDASGNCIWSWHIWSVDYEIEATAQTYASGAVFMDRNLGALTTDCTQPASRGLYYQWGRKDPFLYPATCQETVKRADAVYAAGFEYAENDPRSAASPYEMMSLAWSVSHPTTYMNGVFYEDWEEWASSADWLYDHRPNLWGNMTTGMNNISRTSHKSIYDPCPPGWKIPCAEDFLGIERVSQTMPYYVTVRYDGSGTTRIPLGGTFSEGRYMANGQTGRLYTNNPYHYKWESNSSVFSDISCTSICFSTGSAPYIGTTDYYRFAANPVRCIKE
mgnify:FL=1